MMVDPNIAAGEASRQIAGKLAERGFLPPDGVSQDILQSYMTAVILTAITRCVAPPSGRPGK